MGVFQDTFGSKPTVPVWDNITLGGQQTKAINENIASLPSAEKLASGVSGFNQEQLTAMLNSIIPGWSGMSATAGKNMASELSGQIPTDVLQQIQSSSAAQSLTGGFGGSGMAGNLTAKDLGLTSLNLTQTGQSELENWTGMVDKMFAPGQFNVSSMFVDPQTEFQDTMQNQEMSWSQQWQQNQVSAMPDPTMAAMFKMTSSMGEGMMSGGGGGGGGGGM